MTQTGEWCVQVRTGASERPSEHWVSDVEEFLASLPATSQVRYTHGRSEHIERFRNLDSTEVSKISGTRYTEFGWKSASAKS